MIMRFFVVLLFLVFGVGGIFLPAFAHDWAPTEADGCHECRAKDGCFFFDYWSVPLVTRHCHRASSAFVATTSASLKKEDSPSSSSIRLARVTRVPRGDTIEVEFQDDKKRAFIQLLGVWNSWSLSPTSSGALASCPQKMEEGSRARLQGLALDAKVQLRPSLMGGDSVAHGTSLFAVFRGKKFLNEQMLEDGYGMVDTAHAFEFFSDFSKAEARARHEKHGVWDPGFCEENKHGVLFGTLLTQISRYESLPLLLQLGFAALGISGVYVLGVLIRRSRARVSKSGF